MDRFFEDGQVDGFYDREPDDYYPEPDVDELTEHQDFEQADEYFGDY